MDLVLPRLGDRTFTEPRDNMAASSGVRPTGAAPPAYEPDPSFRRAERICLR